MRIAAMHCSHRLIFTLALFAGSALAQQAAGADDPSAPPASSVPSSTIAPGQSTPAAQGAGPPVKLVPDASGTVPQEQMRELLRYAEERDMENDQRLRNYTYIERKEEHKLDGKGQVKKVEIKTSEILEVYGEPVERLISKDDKPLSAEEARKEDEKIQKVIDKHKHESENDRRKRLEKEEKEREEDRKFVLEISDALNFRLLGSETLNGRDTWVMEGEPRSDYKPKAREARFLSKLKGRVWIDKAEGQWVRLDITAIDTMSFGLFIARIDKGAHIVAEQTKINDDVWLPKHVAARVNVRLVLVKDYNADVDSTFRDYKKFGSDTKITVVGESQ